DITDSRIGFMNKRTTPAYRAFVDVARLRLENFTNQRAEGAMVATVNGRFMGSGPTQVVAHFRPEVDGPDFDMKVAIEATDLTAMNDMLRAHGEVRRRERGLFLLFGARGEERPDPRIREAAVQGRAGVRPRAGPRQERHPEAVRAARHGRRQADEERPAEGSGNRDRHLGAPRRSQGQHPPGHPEADPERLHQGDPARLRPPGARIAGVVVDARSRPRSDSGCLAVRGDHPLRVSPVAPVARLRVSALPLVRARASRGAPLSVRPSGPSGSNHCVARALLTNPERAPLRSRRTT